ncbi:glucosylceramidase [Saccharopolyspora sp. NFXS83]|uniref:glycoside hydrolase family 30 protein n=1 Tax=Saccharopolyspora sp. NFXS83 TaxID=2993560 RepID=UPI00224B6A5D|nr:glycoside hydrolase family 30 beta sandwich domain-containing protein [Saccharopolyspora sp. NFXS83]MCX2732204.1 glucosylceramidase [Saccharopolyspora sp. NFXS83]
MSDHRTRGGVEAPRRGRAAAMVLSAITLSTGLVLAPPAHAAPAVGIWLTTKDGQSKLARQPDAEFGSGGGNETITVDPGTTYQAVDGFGAALTDSSAWLVNNSPRRDEIMSRLFDAESGIGLTALRQVVGASDFARSTYSYDDVPAGESDYELAKFSIAHDEADILPLLRRAGELAPELNVVATPWSAPAWMKSNGSMVGGELPAHNYQVFADYLVRFVQAYEQAGVPIDSLTPQNEPLNDPPSYPGSPMSPDAQAAFIGNDLGPKLDAAGLDTKILAYDHNWDDTDYPNHVLGDANAARYVDGAAFHCYGGTPDAQSAVHDAHPDAEIHLTECSGTESEDPAATFGDTLTWQASNLIIGGTRNWARSVVLWNLALDPAHGPVMDGACSDCTGVTTVNNATGEVDYNAEYYALGHASKFVRPGAVRIGSNELDGVQNVAFRNPDGSTALIALNPGGAERPITVSWQGQEFDHTLPAGGLATFTWPPA